MIPVLLLAATAILPFSDTRNVPQHGPSLALRWKELACPAGAVEFEGETWRPGENAVRIHGRFGAGRFSIHLGAADDTTAPDERVVRYDGVELETEDRVRGWLVREPFGEARPWPERDFLLGSDGDLFSLLPPLADPQWRGEARPGAQIWEYPVRGGFRYRVVLVDAPVRMLRRDLISSDSRLLRSVHYREFQSVSTRLALPRWILSYSPDGKLQRQARTNQLTLRPPLPRLARLPPTLTALLKSGARIAQDERFLAIAARVDEHGSARRDSEALDILDDLEKVHGLHPFLEFQRARIGYRGGNTEIAGGGIRAAAPLGFMVLPLAARIGAREYEATGDSSLLLWAFNSAAPRSPKELTAEDSERFGEIAQTATAALLAHGARALARELLERAMLLDPANGRILDAAVPLALAERNETEALRIRLRFMNARPGEIEPVLALGELHEFLGRDSNAVVFYRERIAKMPAEPELRMRLGTLLVRMKRWADAEDVFDALTEFLEMSRQEAAVAARYRSRMAREYARANFALLKAKRLAIAAVAFDGENPEYLDTLGLIHLRRRDKFAARAAFERALRYRDDAGIRIHLAEAMR